MIRDPNKIGIGARWEEEVFAALPDGEVIWSNGELDYSGHEEIICRLDDGSWLHYSWYYGSCSGCDAWEDNEHKINAEVAGDYKTLSPREFVDYLTACRAADADWIRSLKWPDLGPEIAAVMMATA